MPRTAAARNRNNKRGEPAGNGGDAIAVPVLGAAIRVVVLVSR